MKHPPTDLKLLEHIYNAYYDTFVSFSRDNPSRGTKVYVPIQIQEIADHFGIDGDIIHGRLYYSLDQKYSIVRPDRSVVPFFRFVENVEVDRHQIQFPILASALATLRESRNQFLWATSLAGFSLIVAFAALVVGLKH